MTSPTPHPENPNLVVWRKPNSAYRSREYLTYEEVHRLIEVAGNRGRHRYRDRALLLLMFRHGLRASEAAMLRWDAVMMDFRLLAAVPQDAQIVINRLKGSLSGVHPLPPDERHALRVVRSVYREVGSEYVFVTERGQGLTRGAIAKIISRAGALAKLPLSVHPHMLRHACGYYLANQGYTTRDIQEYLGHRNIQHTVRYTAGVASRFSQFQW